jgi:hypothetical protein
VSTALEAEPDLLTRFATELEQTMIKDAVAQYVRALRGDKLAGASYDELEGRITDGHRYHPAYKSRMGFDPADNYAFGPEFAHLVRPLWIAASNEITEVSASTALAGHEFVRAQLGDPTADRFTDILRSAGMTPDDFPCYRCIPGSGASWSPPRSRSNYDGGSCTCWARIRTSSSLSSRSEHWCVRAIRLGPISSSPCPL